MTVSALAAHLRLSRASALRACREAGVALTATELHYTDARPRARRNWTPLTGEEAERVIRYVRARQGARAIRAAAKSSPDRETR